MVTHTSSHRLHEFLMHTLTLFIIIALTVALCSLFFMSTISGEGHSSGSIIQNALCFWELKFDELMMHQNRLRVNPNYPIDPSRNPAWSVSYVPVYLGKIQYPEFHSRIVVVPDNIIKVFRNRQEMYYFNNQLEWDDALKAMINWIFHHEIGHAVAMKHENSQYYMQKNIPTQYLPPNIGKFFPAGTVHDYSNNSKSEFSIVPPPPPPEQP